MTHKQLLLEKRDSHRDRRDNIVNCGFTLNCLILNKIAALLFVLIEDIYQ
jgi:hypothetical protein